MQLKLVDENDYDAQMRDVVLPALARCREEGWMEPASGDTLPAMPVGSSCAADDNRLHYVCYDAARFDALNETGATGVFHGAVVISHGFTEFASKYSELIWYFLLAGYSVCLLEHRGHGYSARDVDNPSLVWIDDWHRYVEDLAKFARTVGERYADGRPLNLFCHSMGGGIGVGVLERYPMLFDKAVLSSPMIAPATGMPNGVARVLCGVMRVLGMSRRKVFGQGEFSPRFDPAGYEEAAQSRVRWYHQRRCEDVHNQTSCAAFEWARQSLKMSRAIQRPAAVANIDTPVLLFQAGHDRWVLNGSENHFVAEMTAAGGDVRLVRFPDALHEIFSMDNTTLDSYMRQILDFFGSPAVVSVNERRDVDGPDGPDTDGLDADGPDADGSDSAGPDVRGADAHGGRRGAGLRADRQ